MRTFTEYLPASDGFLGCRNYIIKYLRHLAKNNDEVYYQITTFLEKVYQETHREEEQEFIKSEAYMKRNKRYK